MSEQASAAQTLSLEQLLHRHTLSRELSRLYQRQLRSYLDTLALLFRPRRILATPSKAPSVKRQPAPTERLPNSESFIKKSRSVL